MVRGGVHGVVCVPHARRVPRVGEVIRRARWRGWLVVLNRWAVASPSVAAHTKWHHAQPLCHSSGYFDGGFVARDSGRHAVQRR